MRTAVEYRAMGKTELEESIVVLRKEQFKLRMQRANGALDKTHMFRSIRKEIARIKTILLQKVGNSDD